MHIVATGAGACSTLAVTPPYVDENNGEVQITILPTVG